MFSNDELVANIADVAHSLSSEMRGREGHSPRSQVLHQFSYELIRDYLFHLMFAVHHATQSAHLRVIVLFSHQLQLLSAPDLPESYCASAFYGTHFQQPTYTLLVHNEVQNHLSDSHSQSFLKILSERLSHRFTSL